MSEKLQIRVLGNPTLPTLVYLPGLHGDWTMISSFRAALDNRFRLVEITYPRTLAWTIDDYADAIERALLEHEIKHAWLLGESFGSQPAWALVGRNLARADASRSGPGFQIDGLILAAGFVRHPTPGGPVLLRLIGRLVPDAAFGMLMRFYIWYARLLRRRSPETIRDMNEFVARRTRGDRQAMRHRLLLLSRYDPRPIARNCRIPVFYLAGLFDPVVPFPVVRAWLRKHCPGYRTGRTFWLADHNVLVSAPAGSARQVTEWMVRHSLVKREE